MTVPARVRRGVACSSAIPAEVPAALAADPDPDIRWAVASNSHTRPDALATLSGYESVRVREREAIHRDAPPNPRSRLGEDPSGWLKARPATVSMGEDPLTTLAADPEPMLRRAAAQEPEHPAPCSGNFPAYPLLAGLAGADDWETRHGVALTTRRHLPPCSSSWLG